MHLINTRNIVVSIFLSLLCLPTSSFSFKPVIMMHGVGSGAGEMFTIRRLLNQTHRGTLATSLPLYENSPDAWDHDLQTQVHGVIDAWVFMSGWGQDMDLSFFYSNFSLSIRKLIAADPEAYKDGYHLVCKSQGALICRCVIEGKFDWWRKALEENWTQRHWMPMEEMDDHNVDTFVSLAGPQAGVYGTAFFEALKIPLFERTTAQLAYLVVRAE